MAKILAVAVACVALATSGVSAQHTNWGQEVKACNQSGCYPGGTSRGEYVRNQAQDGEKPGYAEEIHRLANPGKSEPNGRKF